VSDTTRPHKGVETATDAKSRREFMRAVLDRFSACSSSMLNEGRFERGVRRVGAEQEMFIIDQAWGPARGVMHMLAQLGHDRHYTTELGQFQLEANCDPQLLTADGLAKMHRQLDDLARPGPARGGRGGHGRGADGHPADHAQGRPGPRQHGAERALPGRSTRS
jgi:hypothetical protein